MQVKKNGPYDMKTASLEYNTILKKYIFISTSSYRIALKLKGNNVQKYN